MYRIAYVHFLEDTFAVADDWTLFTRFRFHTIWHPRRPTSLSFSFFLDSSFLVLHISRDV